MKNEQKPQIIRLFTKKDTDIIELSSGSKYIELGLQLKDAPCQRVGWSIKCAHYDKYFVGEEKVLVSIPYWLCGYPIYIKASYNEKEVQEEPNPFIYTPQYIPINIFFDNSVERTLHTTCKIKINEISWYNNAQSDLDKSSLNRAFVQKGCMQWNVEGLNNQNIHYDISYHKHQYDSRSLYKTTGVVTVDSNQVVFPYSIPKDILDNEQIYIKIRVNKNNNKEVLSKINRYFEWNAKQRQDLGRTIKFEEDRTYNNHELIEETREMVVVGDIAVKNNNFMPCKYTAIKASIIPNKEKAVITQLCEDTMSWLKDILEIKSLDDIEPDTVPQEEVSIFDETFSKTVSDGSMLKTIPYPVVAGTKSVNVQIDIKNHDIKPCKQTHKHQNIAKISDKEFAIQKNGNDGKLSFDINYPYSPNVVPVDCIWPSFSGKETLIYIDTCRHNRAIPIMVYPDVKWAIAFHIGIQRKKVDGVKKIVLDCGIALSCTWDDSANKVSLAVKYPFNNVKKQLKETLLVTGAVAIKDNIERKVDEICGSGTATMLHIFAKICEFFAKYMDGQEAAEMFYNKGKAFEFYQKCEGGIKESYKKYTEKAEKLAKSRKVVEFEAIFPKLSFAGTWCATTHKALVGTKINAKLKGTIFGLKMTYDLFSLVDRIPYLGTAIKVIRVLVDLFLSIETKFDLVVTAQIDASAEWIYNSASRASNGKIATMGTIKLEIKLETTEKTNINATAAVQSYGAKGETGIFIQVAFKHYLAGQLEDTPREGIYGEMTAGMEALVVSLYEEKSVERAGNGGKNKLAKTETKNKKTISETTLIEKINFLPEDVPCIRFFIY